MLRNAAQAAKLPAPADRYRKWRCNARPPATIELPPMKMNVWAMQEVDLANSRIGSVSK
jgi:hypothetical protein